MSDNSNIIRLNQTASAARGVTVTGGSGSGTRPPDLEARLAAVEAGLQRIEPLLMRLDDRLRKIETDTLPRIGTDVARIDGRISQLPTTTTIFGYMGALIGLTLGLGTALIAISRALAQ